MNALSVKSTASTGQPNAGTIADATLFSDPSQYDGVLYSGGPDRARYVIWDLGASLGINAVNADYSGSMSGVLVDFSNDGTTWANQLPGPVGGNGSTQYVTVFLPEGGSYAVARYVRFRPNSPSGDWAIDETSVGTNLYGNVSGPAASSSHCLTGLYNLVNNRTLIGFARFTLIWSDSLSLTLEYSLDGTMESDAAYAAATWTTIPIPGDAPADHGGTFSGPVSFHVPLGYFLDCNLLRLTVCGYGGSANQAELTDFRIEAVSGSVDLWSPGAEGRLWYPAPLLVDGAVGDGKTGYQGA